jgi:hypothetical protein
VFHAIPRIGLPLAADTLATRYNELHSAAVPPKHRFDLSNLAILFELSLGLSAWKSYGAQAPAFFVWRRTRKMPGAETERADYMRPGARKLRCLTSIAARSAISATK